MVTVIREKLAASFYFWILLIRLSLGSVFFQTGWGKLHHLADVTMFFQSLGIPFPHAHAIVVSALEFIGSIAIILGLGTRVFAFLLSGIMVVAIITAQLPQLEVFFDLFGFQEWTFLLLLGTLLFYGAGKISLDCLLCRQRKKSSAIES